MFSTYKSAPVKEQQQKNYNRVVNLCSLKASEVKSVWKEIVLSCCLQYTKKKYSFWEASRWYSRWTPGGLVSNITLIYLHSIRLTELIKLDQTLLAHSVNGPWSTQSPNHWERDLPMCADTLMRFMWGALKVLLDQCNWSWQRGSAHNGYAHKHNGKVGIEKKNRNLFVKVKMMTTYTALFVISFN